MNKNILLYIVILVCFLTTKANDFTFSKIRTPGILRIYLDKMSAEDSLCLQNITMNAKICFASDMLYANFSQEVNCRANFPDYGVLIFDSFQLECNHYKVYCNNGWNFIKNYDLWNFFIWDEFLLSNVLLKTKASNPIYTKLDKRSPILDVNYDNIYLVGIEVKGEWLLVDIFKDEDSNAIASGWVRWRDHNKLLVNLYYSL